MAAFAAKGRCTRCTCLACTSTCAPRGDFPYKSPEFQPISAQSARLVHRIIVPRTFPCTNQTCTITAEDRATLLPPVPVPWPDPYERKTAPNARTGPISGPVRALLLGEKRKETGVSKPSSFNQHTCPIGFLMPFGCGNPRIMLLVC